MNQRLSNYKVVILAGGKGTRLYPITKEIPKPLLPVKRRPILNYLVDLFYSYGIKEIAILINKDFREDFNWWKKRFYPKNKIKIVEEKKPFGTFGGLWFLKNWLKNSQFFLTNGDEIKEIDLRKMASFHQKLKTLATVALTKVPNPKDYGMAICENGLILKFLEKPSPSEVLRSKIWAGKKSANYINAGLYLFSPEIFNYHPGPKFLMIEKDILPKLAKEKKLAGFKFKGKWLDCGTWQRYEEALRK
jgi:NDP-sugar pyrophosphorylase family protein